LIKTQLGTTRNGWLAANTSLWLAQYTTGLPSWPTGTWPNWSLWQYTDGGTVPGFSRPLDCDRFNGSDADFLKMSSQMLASRLDQCNRPLGRGDYAAHA